MSFKLYVLSVIGLFILLFTGVAIAQSTPTATVNQTNQDWAPGETVSVNWSTTGFGSQSVKTDISLVSTSSNRTYGLWNSGGTLGNYLSGTKTIRVNTSGTNATLTVDGGLSVTVPTGSYILRVHVKNRLIAPIGNQTGYLSAINTSRSFNILSNIPCQLTLRKTGANASRGSLSSNPITSIPVGQTAVVYYSTNGDQSFQTNRYIIKVNNVVVTDEVPQPSGGHFNTPTCEAGKVIDVSVDFGPRPSCQVTGSVSPYEGGQYTFSSNIIGGKLPVGLNGSVTFDPHDGYGVAETKKNGTLLNTYTPPQASNVEVPIECPAGDLSAKSASATFKLAPWEVTSKVNNPEGGEIIPLGKVSVPSGQDGVFTIKPKSEYEVEWVKIDGIEQTDRSLNQIVKYDSTKKNRTIEVKFRLKCLSILPETTIDNLNKGLPAQINKPTFSAWVSENQDLVKGEIEMGQCSYMAESDSRADSFVLSNYMRSAIRGSIQPLLRNNKPAIGVLVFVGDITSSDSTGSNIERDTDLGYHAVLVTDIKTTVVSRPPRNIYEIKIIDSNGPQTNTLRCEDSEASRFIRCDIPPAYSSFDSYDDIDSGMSIKVRTKFLYMLSPSVVDRRNTYLGSLRSVRRNPKDWITSNYTKINNYIIPNTPGVCLGWSEFNAKAAQLIKECPFKADTRNPNPVVSLEYSMSNKPWLSRQSALVWQVIDNLKTNILKSIKRVVN